METTSDTNHTIDIPTDESRNEKEREKEENDDSSRHRKEIHKKKIDQIIVSQDMNYAITYSKVRE